MARIGWGALTLFIGTVVLFMVLASGYALYYGIKGLGVESITAVFIVIGICYIIGYQVEKHFFS